MSNPDLRNPDTRLANLEAYLSSLPRDEFDRLINNARRFLAEEEERRRMPTSPTTQGVTRRKFLQTAAVTAGAIASGAGGWKLAQEAWKKLYVPPQKEALATPNPYLGIENNNPATMPLLLKTGATHVRIQGGESKVSGGTLINFNAKDALTAAKNSNLKVLYVFDSQYELTPDETDRRLQTIFSFGPEITVELGDKPDTKIPSWRDQDLTPFAKFVKTALDRKTALEKMGKIPPSPPMVIGALNSVEHTAQLIAHLKKLGITNFSNLTFAVCAHNKTEAIQKVGTIKEATGGTGIMFTEISTNSDVGSLADLYKQARTLSKKPVFIQQTASANQDPASFFAENLNILRASIEQAERTLSYL